MGWAFTKHKGGLSQVLKFTSKMSSAPRGKKQAEEDWPRSIGCKSGLPRTQHTEIPACVYVHIDLRGDSHYHTPQKRASREHRARAKTIIGN